LQSKNPHGALTLSVKMNDFKLYSVFKRVAKVVQDGTGGVECGTASLGSAWNFNRLDIYYEAVTSFTP